MAWLNSWECFVKSVEGGSMAAAARRLGCTRAQVSKQIGDLERSFGVRLFERSTRKLGLTPAGEVFYQHAVQALDAVESAEVAVKNQGDVPRGLLRVSAAVAFGRIVLAPLLPRIAAKYPELECELILADQPVDLVDDRIDLALRMTRQPPQDAVARPLIAIERVICAAPAYLAAQGEPATPGDLAQHQCFSYLLTDERVWHLLSPAGEEIQVPVKSRFQFNEIGCLYDAVLAGQGLAILPRYLCGPGLARGELQVVLPGFEPIVPFGRHLYACYAPSRSRAPKVKVFLDELAALLSPVPPWAAR
jgi:DNA-binding transcriptional LysR family regulator